MLLTPTTIQSLRVGILGSGISGATAARTLADKGVTVVTVFEAGYGVGGRTSTRITPRSSEDPEQTTAYQFDHGAQYIGSPKTIEFQQTLESRNGKGPLHPSRDRRGLLKHQLRERSVSRLQEAV